MQSVCVIGSTNRDVTVLTAELPKWEAESYVDRLLIEIGGKGFHMARAAAWLGADVFHCTPIGADPDADIVRSHLAALSAEIAAAPKSQFGGHAAPGSLSVVEVASAGPTGFVVALMRARDQPTYIASRERYHWNGITHLPSEWEAPIECASVLLISIDAPLPVVGGAIAHARRHGTRVVLNLSPSARGEAEISEAEGFFSDVDVLVLGQIEARRLASPDSDPDQLLRELQRANRPFEVLCITGNGCEAVVAEKPGTVRISRPQHKAMSSRVSSDSVLCACLGVALAREEEPSAMDSFNFALAASSVFAGHQRADLEAIHKRMSETGT